ncbi:MAG: M42 family peptidase [Planctomycetota bacterium]
MEKQPLDFFRDILATPSPSGFEEAIVRVGREYLQPFARDMRIDIHGNLITRAGDIDNPAAPKLLYAGHCDQIGMLISHIDEQGFLYAQTIGGWDPQQLIGQAMVVWPSSTLSSTLPNKSNLSNKSTLPKNRKDAGGSESETTPTRSFLDGIPAVISRKPIHLLAPKERSRVVDLNELWLDIGARDFDHARELVAIGDCVTLDLRHRRLAGDLMSGPGMDNKSGMFVVLDALRRATADAQTLRCQLHSVATVQEEIGLRGAKTAAGSIHPDVAIAVDVTHASDCPTIDKNQQGDIRVGGGPVIFRGPNINRRVADRLVQLAQEKDIPFQIAAIARATPNDANALQIHGGGVAVGLVAIPNRYMHSAVEVVSTADLDAAADLLSAFALSLTPECDFTPKA